MRGWRGKQEQCPDQRGLASLRRHGDERRNAACYGRRVDLRAILIGVVRQNRNEVVIGRVPVFGLHPCDGVALQVFGLAQRLRIGRHRQIYRKRHHARRPGAPHQVACHVRDRVAEPPLASEQQLDGEQSQEPMRLLGELDGISDRPGCHLVIGKPHKTLAERIDVALAQRPGYQAAIMGMAGAGHAGQVVVQSPRR